MVGSSEQSFDNHAGYVFVVVPRLLRDFSRRRRKVVTPPATQESSGNDFVCANPVTWGPNRRAILSTSQINFEQQNAAITEHIWLVRNAVSRILAERVPS